MSAEQSSSAHQFGSYRDLEVWQLGMHITEQCYRLSRAFPREEMFGLVSQIRRWSSSIALNVAEGWGRDQTGEFIRFLRIANGSLKETETALELSVRLGFVDQAATSDLVGMCEREGKMIRSPIRSLEKG